jgi:hypothetical protein
VIASLPGGFRPAIVRFSEQSQSRFAAEPTINYPAILTT